MTFLPRDEIASKAIPHAAIYRLISRVAIVLSILGMLAWSTVFAVDQRAGIRIVAEDGQVQWLQFACLAAAVVPLAILVRGHSRQYRSRFLRNVCLALLGLTVFVAGEEISWGQRLLGFKTPPALLRINVQKQATVHNLRHLQRVRHWPLVAVGAAGLLMIFRPKQLIGSLRLHPHAMHLRPDPEYAAWFALILASGVFVEATDLAKLIPFLADAGSRMRFVAGRYSEFGELFVAVAAIAYASGKWLEMRSGSWPAAAVRMESNR